MKKLVLLTAIIVLLAQALLAQNQGVTLSVKDKPLKEVFSLIEKQTPYTFLYKNELLTGKKNVSVNVTGMSVSKLLTQLLSPLSLTYEFDDNVFVIKAVNPTTQSSAKKRLISGIILDDENLPLPGATINIKNSTTGSTISDIDGTFSLSIPDDNNVVILATFIGMKPQEVVVGDQKNLNIKLLPTSVLLNDFVLVGAYGTMQKRSDLVGSAYQVDAEKIKNLPTGRLDNMLEGMVPGLQISYNSDLASNTRPRYNTRVRGESSMAASSEPLWIVNGVPVYTGGETNLVPGLSSSISPLSYINPEDIESFTVLKDAASTSIYGANGANGVILITTKSGQLNLAPKLSISTKYGVSKINKTTLFKVLDANQYMTLAKEAWTNAGKDMKYFPFQDNSMNSYSTTNTNWTDIYYGSGSTAQTNLKIRGGSDKVAYLISGAYYNNKMTIKGNDQQRFSILTNTDIKFNSKVSASLNLSSSYNINNIFNPGDDYYNILPIYSPYDLQNKFRLFNSYVSGSNPDGSPKFSTVRFFNSVAEREENDDRQRTMATNANLSLKYDILKSLQFTSQVGFDYQSAFENKYSARTNWSGMSLSEGAYGYATRSNANFLLWTVIERLNFKKLIAEKHSVSGVAGFEATSKEYYSVGASGSGYVNDLIKEITYAVDDIGTSSASLVRTASFFAQGTYSYDSRYYFQVSARRDGSSDFGSDVRWANFGSTGLSWNLHNEEFYNLENVDLFKLKLTYGSNGNSRLGSVQSSGVYSYNEGDNYIDNQGASMSTSPNPTLSWETSRQLNLGVRLRMFKKLDIDIEAYNKNTFDLISNLDVSRLTGTNRVYRNVGQINNKGIEATIGAEILKSSNSEWTAELNMSHNKNTIVELYNGLEKSLGSTIWKEGYDINTYYLVRWAGVDPRDGAPLWLDLNGNLTRVYNNANRVPFKSSSPDLTGGLSTNYSYKRFSAYAIMSYVIGGYSFSNFSRRVSSDGLNIMDENQSVNQLDRWQKPGDMATSPKPIWGVSTGSVMNSTRYLYKTTYALLRNLAISYDFTGDALNNAGIANLRLSLIGDNLGLWTPFDKKNRNSYRQARSGYPMETSFSLALECTF